MRLFNPIVTGSLRISGSIESVSDLDITVTSASVATTASYVESSSYALTASHAVGVSVAYSNLTSIPSNIVSGSAQVKSFLPAGTVTGSAQTIANLPSGVLSGSLDYSGSYHELIVKVVNDNGNKYQIDGITAPNLTLQRGQTYRLNLEDSSNSNHPLAFREPDDTQYTNGVWQQGTAGSAGAYTQFYVGYNVPTQLKYYCTVHGNGMGAGVRINEAFNTTLSGSVVITGSLDVTGDITAFSTSDERLKTNVTPILDGLNKVGEIQGYEYDWIENIHHNKAGHDIGVIAQEVEKIAPEAVTTRDNGYKAVNYEKLIPILIQAIKELNDKVNKLEDANR